MTSPCPQHGGETQKTHPEGAGERSPRVPENCSDSLALQARANGGRGSHRAGFIDKNEDDGTMKQQRPGGSS